MEITVVGAGIVGLTTAWVLDRAGHTVRVVTDADGLHATSGAAGAVWYPYLAEPLERVNRWAHDTHAWLTRLARSSPAAGVRDGAPTWLAAADDERPPWAEAVPADGGLVFVSPERIPEPLRRRLDARGRPPAGAWRFRSPVVDPPTHLAWLRDGLARPVEEGVTVADLDEVAGEVVVHCTGCRAGALVADAELRPRFGQVVVARAAGLDDDAVLADDRVEADLFYTIPKGERFVLGGVNLEHETDADTPWNAPGPATPRPELTRDILERCRRAGIVASGPLQEKAGWRPVRTTVRVEREGRVVHDYGHGGAGFTLAYGCARTVLELIEA